MKHLHFITVLLGTLLQSFSYAHKQEPDSTGALGDNLDLYGVLELFKNSENTEEFEKAINSDENNVNNLDLNNDGKVDYIKALDYLKENARAIALQIDINEKETQSIAVLEIDKTGNETATIQIIGDEDLYGENYIVEPLDTKEEGSILKVVGKIPLVVNVWHWKPMRHYYGPKYVVWVSPWHWTYLPAWYKPWKPLKWRVYHTHVIRYHNHCHRVNIHRAPHIRAVYHPHRKTATLVKVHHTNKTKINNSPRKSERINRSEKSRKSENNTQLKSSPKKATGGNQKQGGRRAGGGKQNGGKRGR